MSEQQASNPFEASGDWYRGCLHAHTTESDGRMSPEHLVEHYRRAGFDFLALTDHEKLTERPELGGPDFLLVRGTELAVGRTELGERFHIVGIGVRRAIPRGETPLAAGEAIAEIRRQGGEAIVAHPYWSGLTAADLLDLPDYVAVEVYNTTCQVSIGRGNSAYVWDELLTRGRPVRVVAADDCHRPGHDSLRAWTMLRAPELSEPAILAALRRGHFYASTGPEIYAAARRDGAVEVECSPVQAIELVCDPTRGSRLEAGAAATAVRAVRRRGRQRQEGVVEGELLTGAVLEVPARARYARLQVVDATGRTAWTNLL